MFRIDFSHLVKSNVPQSLKTAFNVALSEWWLKPAKTMHESAYAFGERQLQIARTTGQIGSLVETLNNVFDAEPSIYIEDVQWVDDVHVYLDAEPYNTLYIYTDGENVEEEIFFYTDTEVNPIQYIIYIPAHLNFPNIIEQIRAEATLHGLAGKYFTIQLIP